MKFRGNLSGGVAARAFMRAPDDEGSGGGGGSGAGAGAGADPGAGAGAGDQTPPAPPEFAAGWGVEKPEHIEALKRFETPDALFDALKPADPNAWRNMMAGDDAEKMKRLERFTDPAAVFKAFEDAQDHIRSSDRIKVPAPDAPAEEIAEFAKKIGLPEKPEDFKITAAPPEGYEPTDEDKSFLGDLTKRLHAEIGANPRPEAIVNAAHKIFYELAAGAGDKMEERADAVSTETDQKLTALWGAQKDINLKFYKAALVEHFGPEGAEEFKKIRLEDGSYLGDRLDIVKAFAAIGRMTVEDNKFLELSGGTPGAGNVEEQYQAAIRLKVTDPKKYATPEHQTLIQTLLAAKARGQQAGARV